jgi:cysteine desulfurase / selenocysteine lyase
MALSFERRWRQLIVGLDLELPRLDGRLAPFVNLDNAASTPPLQPVVDAIQRFLPYYAAVHRGTGYKARVSTEAYDQAHRTIAEFVGASPDTNTVIFGKNTTEAINKLAYRYPLPAGCVIVSTLMEHHSNDLPWRHRATLVRAAVRSDGRLDEDDVDRLLAKYGERVALLLISGASNVTGFVQPIHRLARKAHAVGGRIVVDAAQLASHRPIDVKADDDPEHIDFVVLSAHKMYAPFGTGALIGPRDVFLRGDPEYRGGGQVVNVTPDDVLWAGLPDREEAGSPNVVGAIAMAAAARALMAESLEHVQVHEAGLTRHALARLRTCAGVRLYGERDPQRTDDRVGVITFNVGALDHALVSAILGYEGGIGVRAGCFCAQPYVRHLLSLSGEHPSRPGMVRISFGAYNTTDEIDACADMLECITRRAYRGEYHAVPDRDEYVVAESLKEAYP